MPTTTPIARSARIAGRIASTIAVLFLTMDGAMKFTTIPAVVQGTAQLGWSPSILPTLGVLMLAGVALYVVPRTSILGAILLTGYLGGAVATHVRVHNPLFTHILFPTYLGALLWGGLWLRDPRVRALFVARTSGADRQPVLLRRAA